MIAYFTALCVEWSQSITNKVIKAFKSVYDFIVFVGCEIGKHNYTIQVYIYDRIGNLYRATREKLRTEATGHRRRLCFKVLRYLFYGFILFCIVNFIIVMLRERFELKGCALCID